MVPKAPRYVATTVELMDRIAQGGVPKWEMEWESDIEGRYRAGGLPLRADDTPFQGESRERLWQAGWDARHRYPYWLTAEEVRDKGGVLGQIARGVTVRWAVANDGSLIDAGAAQDHGRLRYEEHTVYNSEFIHGLPEHYQRRPWQVWSVNPDEEISVVEDFIKKGLGLKIGLVVGRRERSTPRFFENSGRIDMPGWGLFHGAAGYYRALCHEVVHWSRQRLHGTFDERYTLQRRKPWEELVADFGSAFLLRDLLGPQVALDNHVTYLNHWSGGGGDDALRVLAAAAGAAEGCVEWLHAEAPGHRIADGPAGERVSPLDATRRARRFVAEAEDLRGADYRNNPALIRDGLRLLVVADRIDLGLAEVRNAIVAAAVLTTTGPLRTPIPAEAYLEAVRRDLRGGMERAVVEVHRKWNDGPEGGLRL